MKGLRVQIVLSVSLSVIVAVLGHISPVLTITEPRHENVDRLRIFHTNQTSMCLDPQLN